MTTGILYLLLVLLLNIWSRSHKQSRKYLYYKKMVMVHYYGGKTDIMKEAAKLHGLPIVDLPVSPNYTFKGTKTGRF